MGNKSQQRRRINEPRKKPSSPAPSTQHEQPQQEPGRIPVPQITQVDVVFGEIKHMPRYETVPERFKCRLDPYFRFVSDWFFFGRKPEDMQRLTARPGVDGNQALAAIKAILVSWEPKHEHKEAGCAYLLEQWFEIDDN